MDECKDCPKYEALKEKALSKNNSAYDAVLDVQLEVEKCECEKKPCV